jgi:hypothetical protein
MEGELIIRHEFHKLTLKEKDKNIATDKHGLISKLPITNGQ